MVTSVEARQTRLLGGRRYAWPLLAALCAAGLAWGGWSWWVEHRYKAAMAGIESSIMGGHYALACRDLESLLSWKADPNGGIVYLLGSCELARGRNQAASEAWARVRPGTAFWEKAIRGRVRLLQESGHYSAVEELVSDAAQDRRSDPTAVRLMLLPLFSDLGRIEEAERLIEDRWEHENDLGEGALEPAIKLILQHIGLTLNEPPVEKVSAVLNRAAGLAPQDDRVWLGRANLAIRTGKLEEAGRLLDSCQKRRPHDVAVWRARLSWGIIAKRTDAVQQAMTHLTREALKPSQLHRIQAWLAAQQRDITTERQQLEQLLVADPADLKALNRLAQLAEANDEPDRAARLRQRMDETNRLQALYEILYQRKQPIRDAVKMAKLAEQLGRIFVARGFLTIALANDPNRDDLRRDSLRLIQSRTTRTK
jgi:tetratricopeptide (TPR) repeat protein